MLLRDRDKDGMVSREKRARQSGFQESSGEHFTGKQVVSESDWRHDWGDFLGYSLRYDWGGRRVLVKTG